MAGEADITENLNKKTNSKDMVVFKPKAIRAIRRGDYTRPVSFITETEVYQLADAARAMRDGERNELRIVTLHTVNTHDGSIWGNCSVKYLIH